MNGHIRNHLSLAGVCGHCLQFTMANHEVSFKKHWKEGVQGREARGSRLQPPAPLARGSHPGKPSSVNVLSRSIFAPSSVPPCLQFPREQHSKQRLLLFLNSAAFCGPFSPHHTACHSPRGHYHRGHHSYPAKPGHVLHSPQIIFTWYSRIGSCALSPPVDPFDGKGRSTSISSSDVF